MKSSTARVVAIAVGAAIGGFLFGYDTSTMNAAITGMTQTLSLAPGTVGLVMAVALIGAAIGAWFAGKLSARFGRTRVMLLAGTLIALGSVVVAFSSSVALTTAARVATGLGIGTASAVVPAYIAEISPPDIRGRLGSIWQLAIVTGQLLGLVVGFALTAWAGAEAATLALGGAAWQWMFLVVAALALVYAAISFALPASPYDAEAGRRGDLSALKGETLGLKKIVWVGILLAVFQQFVGISVVKMYSNALWQIVGFGTGASFTISIVTVLISIASTLFAIALVDRVGRGAPLWRTPSTRASPASGSEQTCARPVVPRRRRRSSRTPTARPGGTSGRVNGRKRTVPNGPVHVGAAGGRRASLWPGRHGGYGRCRALRRSSCRWASSPWPQQPPLLRPGGRLPSP